MPHRRLRSGTRGCLQTALNDCEPVRRHRFRDWTELIVEKYPEAKLRTGVVRISFLPESRQAVLFRYSPAVDDISRYRTVNVEQSVDHAEWKSAGNPR